VREIARMIIVLTAIAIVSGTILGFLERVTKEPIEYQKLKFVKGPAVLAVLSGYTNDPIKSYKKDVPLEEKDHQVVRESIFPAEKDGKCFAVAFEVRGQGYHGTLGIMIGIDLKTGKLTGMRVTTHTETPGLGARIVEPSFYTQFSGQGIQGMALSSKGGKINAVSGASISSRGAVEAVRKGLELFQLNKEKIVKAVCRG
jgi:electron transport complex protein RnfG